MPDITDDGSKGAPTGAAAIQQIVENARAADDNQAGDDDNPDDDDNSDDDNGSNDTGSDDKDDTQNDDDNADDQGDDDDNSDDDDSDDDQPVRKLSQFAGDGTDEAYISNLEKGYLNTSQEAVRLKRENDEAKNRLDAITKAAAADTDLAAKVTAALGGKADTGSDSDTQINPFISDLQKRWEENSEKEIEERLGQYPQLQTDPALGEDVKKWMTIFSNQYLKDHGKLMTGGEAMDAALKHLGIEQKLEKQNLAKNAKKIAAPARTNGGKKGGGNKGKAQFSDTQIAMAKAMGHDEDWLKKNMK